MFFNTYIERFYVTILFLQDASTSESLEHLVCWVYSAAVSQLPALIRQWWSNTDTRISQVVDRVTSAYVSPQLCNQELMDVAQHETKFKNMVVSIFLVNYILCNNNRQLSCHHQYLV